MTTKQVKEIKAMTTKQVIVIRRDLKMRRGKEITQGGHSVLSFLTRKLEPAKLGGGGGDMYIPYQVSLTKEEVDWINSSYAKICVKVHSEEELLSVVEKARAAGLTTHLITDCGRTEFGGIATHTCCCIGPHKIEKFEGITSDLELY